MRTGRRAGLAVAAMMTAAATDHLFLDGGHTLDFTNKAFEAVELLGEGRAAQVLPTLVEQTARASRAEDGGRWRHPHDLVGLVEDACGRLPEVVALGATAPAGWDDVSRLAWTVLGQGAQAVSDTELLAAVTACHPETIRTMKWTVQKIKEASPQVLAS